MTELQSKIIELRNQELSQREIAKRLNISRKAVQQCLYKFGYKGAVRRNQFDYTQETWKDIFERMYPSLEFIYNDGGIEGYNYVQCRYCGNVYKYTAQMMKPSHLSEGRCLNCNRLYSQHLAKEKREKELEQREREQQQRQNERWRRTKPIQLKMEVCLRCNALFIPKYKGMQYCSSVCSNRARYATHKDHRIKKLRNVIVDKNITLMALYQRDGGKCWLCGKACDYNADSNDNSYPSIDHVIPLSKGGKHSWENVKLAHRGCNSAKGSRLIVTETSR